jgi:asparagine synthase (glutamine-hydrolysing)
MGIKPLYVWPRPEGIAFASEVKALRALPHGPSHVDPEAIVHYLAWGHVPAPLTITSGVEHLVPASWMRWKGGVSAKRTYWEFPAVDTQAVRPYLYNSRDEAAEALRPLLREAVAYRYISDAPLGAFLSGGIDSSAVVSLMRASGQERLHTVSVSFPQTPLDEGPYALKVAEQFGTAHTDISVSARNAKEALEDFFAAMDQPTCDGFNTYLVSKYARQAGLTVSMSGLGGDELFAGYRHFRRIIAAEPWLDRFPRAIVSAGVRAARNSAPRLAKLEALALPGPALTRLYYGARGLFSPGQIRSLVQPSVLADTALGQGEASALLPPASLLKGSGGRPLSRFHSIAALELRRYMHDQLLRDSDVFGLAHAVEIRVPLIDHRIVELIFNTAPQAVLSRSAGHRQKALLIQSLPAALPPLCTNRPKMGFTVPFDDWLRTAWRGGQGGLLDSLGPGGDASAGARAGLLDCRLSDRLHWSRSWSISALRMCLLRQGT